MARERTTGDDTADGVPDGADGRLEPADALGELGRLVLGEHSMQTVLQQVADLTRAVVPGAMEVSVTLLRGDQTTTVVYTGQLAKDMDEGQYARGYGPCLDAAATGERVQIDDAATETRCADYAKVAAAAGSRSSMSLPVPLQEYVSAAQHLRRPAARLSRG